MTGNRQWYRGYGLIIDSVFAIPGAVPLSPDAGPPDIVIREGTVAATPGGITDGPYYRCADSLLLDVPGVARYLARSPSELTIAPYPGGDPADVAALLVATGLPMLLWMRGGIVLHAAGLIVPEAAFAIALAGPSGIGKSSLAHRLLANGARLLGDDSLLLSASDGRSQVSGLPASYFLSGRSAEQREVNAVPPQQQIDSALLGAIIVLCASDQHADCSPVRLTGPAALEALLQNRHRPRIPGILGRSGALLPTSALHCRNVPVYRLLIPPDNVAMAHQRLASLIHAIAGPELSEKPPAQA